MQKPRKSTIYCTFCLKPGGYQETRSNLISSHMLRYMGDRNTRYTISIEQHTDPQIAPFRMQERTKRHGGTSFMIRRSGVEAVHNVLGGQSWLIREVSQEKRLKRRVWRGGSKALNCQGMLHLRDVDYAPKSPRLPLHDIIHPISPSQTGSMSQNIPKWSTTG